ncbi:MAG: radical SAM/Cys-rich domain protein [Coriobacteriales bacterium]|nr:radical SAM/Cys-rich domain protein [Coriobacteriales bacterium]
MESFVERITALGRPELLETVDALTTLQVNVGTRCNLQCKHCHVQASPTRTEAMSRETLEACIRVFAQDGFQVLDITGGAPELHQDYRWLIDEGAKLVAATALAPAAPATAITAAPTPAPAAVAPPAPAVPATAIAPTPAPPAPAVPATAIAPAAVAGRVITRTNLVILGERGYGDLPEFWAERGVEVVASLPSWEGRSTDRQRGDGVFEQAIAGLRALNAVGYGAGAANAKGQPLVLNLVSNPGGAFLPPAQASAEREFRQNLAERYSVTFDKLLTITNNPVGRFKTFLETRGILNGYMERLGAAFNPTTVEHMMCRSQVSVAWDGRTYDCDFNQAAGLPLEDQPTIAMMAEQGTHRRALRLADHCYACTAGAGSSCGGATV